MRAAIANRFPHLVDDLKTGFIRALAIDTVLKVLQAFRRDTARRIRVTRTLPITRHGRAACLEPKSQRRCPERTRPRQRARLADRDQSGLCRYGNRVPGEVRARTLTAKLLVPFAGSRIDCYGFCLRGARLLRLLRLRGLCGGAM